MHCGMAWTKYEMMTPEQFSCIASRRNRSVLIETTYPTVADTVESTNEESHIVDGVQTVLLLRRCKYVKVLRKDVGTKGAILHTMG